MHQKHALTTVRALRNFFHHTVLLRTELYENRINGKWLLFHTALDTIEDGLIAVDTFQQQSAEHIQLNPLLSLAGLLQLIYVQLDAVKFLVESFEGPKAEKDFFGEKITNIRYLRNQTIGHPVKNTGGKRKMAATEIAYTLLPVLLINESSFTFTLQFANGKSKDITSKFRDIFKSVDAFIHTKISILLEQFQQEEQQYKAQFRNIHLAIFDLAHYRWYKSRLKLGVSEVGSNTNSYLVIYNLIHKDIETFIHRLNARIPISSRKFYLETIHDTLQRLQHIMTRLSPDMISGIDNFEVQIYVDALIQSIDELQSIALELDEKYESIAHEKIHLQQ